jgi:DNA-binding response OmpR family regulator
MLMRALVAEDEERLAASVARGLRRAGWAVDVVHSGTEARDRLDGVAYDVLVLDRDLPGIHGDELCRELSQRADRPRILMLTAAAAVADRVAGLELGADDYLPKPFAFAELLARMRALSRREGRALAPVLTHGDLTLDPSRRAVGRAGREIPLTPKEFGVLEALLRAGGAVLSAEDLLRMAWDEQADPFSNTVRVTLMTLRRKLGDPPVIETVIGSGYRLA